MRLDKFRVANFRNVNESGWIDLAGTTALVGRNESGKTNLLHALRALSGPDAGEELSLTRDFPADRMRSEYSDELDLVATRWRLSEEERRELAEILPRARDVTAVEVSRGYPPERRVKFCGLDEAPAQLDKARDLVAQLASLTSDDEEPASFRWSQAMELLQESVGPEVEEGSDWASSVGLALSDLEDICQSGLLADRPEVSEVIESISDLSKNAETRGSLEDARRWVLSRLPTFLYLDEYPDIDGHMDLPEFDRRRKEGLAEGGDRHFETLLRMAGIDPDGLSEILDGDPETRRQIVGRAGAGLTRKLREIWTDRPLKVRFNLDGNHFNTLVCDPTAVCDIEVNLNQRSRGFRWFFSFFVMLTASRQEPGSADAILLLDEPGLHLHASGQQDLLRHLTEIDNQSIIATQSPFMVPQGDSAAVRAVRFQEEEGTRVSDDPSADELGVPSLVQPGAARPAQADVGTPEAPAASEQASAPALATAGELVSALFGSDPVLVVENLTDFWYLSAIANHFASLEEESLPKDLVLVPAGGSVLLPQLMALLGEPATNPIVVLSSSPPDQVAASLSQETCRDHGVVFIGSGFSTPPSQKVEIEDLIDPDIYDRFVGAAYRDKLIGKDLQTDVAIACAVERYDDAFDRIGMTFSRREPARLIAKGNERNLRTLLSRQTGERFERLFAEIRRQLEALGA